MKKKQSKVPDVRAPENTGLQRTAPAPLQPDAKLSTFGSPEHRAELARELTPKADEYHGVPPLQDALSLVQHARELEARRGRTNALPDGCFALQRLLVAILESMTPEQRADVRRRLGE